MSSFSCEVLFPSDLYQVVLFCVLLSRLFDLVFVSVSVILVFALFCPFADHLTLFLTTFVPYDLDLSASLSSIKPFTAFASVCTCLT